MKKIATVNGRQPKKWLTADAATGSSVTTGGAARALRKSGRIRRSPITVPMLHCQAHGNRHPGVPPVGQHRRRYRTPNNLPPGLTICPPLVGLARAALPLAIGHLWQEVHRRGAPSSTAGSSSGRFPASGGGPRKQNRRSARRARERRGAPPRLKRPRAQGLLFNIKNQKQPQNQKNEVEPDFKRKNQKTKKTQKP